jgi:hypothetical protein
MNKLSTRVKAKLALFRFLRVIVPQLPGLFLAYEKFIDVKWLPAWVFAGAVVTALDKFFREMGYY